MAENLPGRSRDLNEPGVEDFSDENFDQTTTKKFENYHDFVAEEPKKDSEEIEIEVIEETTWPYDENEDYYGETTGQITPDIIETTQDFETDQVVDDTTYSGLQ